MNKKQRLFLYELDKLLRKYNISEVLMFSGGIYFKSNGSALSFISYDRDSGSVFRNIRTSEDAYLVENQDPDRDD